MNDEKVYVLDAYGESHNIVLRKTTYFNNKTLAVFMIELMPDGSEEPWADLTKNIADSNFCANDSSAFVDTNNLGNSIILWLEKNNIAFNTGILGYSGFCTYPLVLFKDEVLKDMRTY